MNGTRSRDILYLCEKDKETVLVNIQASTLIRGGLPSGTMIRFCHSSFCLLGLGFVPYTPMLSSYNESTTSILVIVRISHYINSVSMSW